MNATASPGSSVRRRGLAVWIFTGVLATGFMVICWRGPGPEQNESGISAVAPMPAPAVVAERSKAAPIDPSLPARHPVNLIPSGVEITDVFPGRTLLAWGGAAGVPAGFQARVLLASQSGPEKLRRVRIEEIFDTAEGRLAERRVMAADHAVVWLKDGVNSDILAERLPAGYQLRKKSPAGQRCLISFAAEQPDALPEAMKALSDVPGVSMATHDGYVFSSAVTPDDQYFAQQWALLNTGQTVGGVPELPGLPVGVAGAAGIDIDGPEAWDFTTGSSARTVAVLDSGIDFDHEDLLTNIWQNPGESGGGKETNDNDDDGSGYKDDVKGWDFVNEDNDPRDDFGHGSHVAGIIGARGNNGVGIAGVCWDVRLVSLKVLGSNGAGLWSDVMDAIAYASAKKLNVANLSLGAYGNAPPGVHTAIEQAYNLLFVCAAGNGSGTGGASSGDNLDALPFVPATIPLGHVISVGAINQQGQRVGFSNYGHVGVDLFAPGANILSTKMGGGYEFKSGTSMAAAFVSGAAVHAQVRKLRAPLEVRQMIQAGVNRAPRMTNVCSTEGRLWLQRASLQGTRNIRWPLLGSNMFWFGWAHVMPDGRLRAWRDISTNLGEGNYPSMNGLLSVVPASPFLIDSDLRLLSYQTFIASGSTAELANALETPASGNHHLRYVKNGTGVIAAAGARYDTGGLTNSAYIFLKFDGTVWSFGITGSWIGREVPPNGSPGVPAQIPGLSGIIQIANDAQGQNHFALRADGVLLAFGRNSGMQLGFGHNQAVPTATLVPGFPPLAEIFYNSSGAMFCLTFAGEVWGYGNNGTNPRVDTPVRMAAWDGCVDFHTGIGSFAARADGAVVESNAQVIPGLTGFSRAPNGTRGVDDRGRVWERGTGKLFRPQNNPYDLSAVLVPVLAPASECTEIGNTAVVLLSDGRTQAWGMNVSGTLGNGIGSHYDVPVEVPELKGVHNFEANGEHVLAWWDDDSIYSLGSINQFNPSAIQKYQMPSLSDVKQMKSTAGGGGPSRLWALRDNGTVWFFDRSAHFNPGGTINTQPFVQSPLPPGIVQIAYGQGRSLIALDNASQIWALHYTPYQLPAPVNITGPLPPEFGTPVQIEFGENGYIILCSDGKVWTFDFFDTSPTGVTLASRGLRFLADAGPVKQMSWPAVLKTDGTVWTWPRNGSAFVEVTGLWPPGVVLAPVEKVVSTEAGSSRPAFTALRSDGTLWTWGDGPYLGRGPLFGTTPYPPAKVPTIADAKDIWPGAVSTYARRGTDGKVWGWGSNSAGVIGGGAYASTPVETLNYNISPQVLNSGLGFSDWLTRFFSNADLGSIELSGTEADPDRDGLSNILEYALGTHPKKAFDRDISVEGGGPAELKASFEAAPSRSLSMDGEGGGATTAGDIHFVIRLYRRTVRSGIRYIIEVSDDMVTWRSGPSNLLEAINNEELLMVYDPVPVKDVRKRFARLRIEQQ